MPFSVFSVPFEEPTDDVLVWFAHRFSRSTISPFGNSFTNDSSRLSAHLIFGAENYTVAVVKTLKRKVTELGISNL